MRLRQFMAMVTHDTLYAPKIKWTREYRAWLRNSNIYTFFPPTYSFNFIWLFCFFLCGVCVTLLCPHSGRSETVSFFQFEFAFITMQWICKKERSPLVRSICFMYIHVERCSTDCGYPLFVFAMINHIQNKLFSDFSVTR